MSKCNSCRHYRPVEPGRTPAQALRWLSKSPLSTDTASEFKRIADAERGKWEVETKTASNHTLEISLRMEGVGLDFSAADVSSETRAVFNARVRPWLKRGPFNEEPRTIPHCNADADRESYHLPAVRNWADSCTEANGFAPRDRAPNCSACRFYRKSETEVRLRAEARRLRQMVHQVNAAGAQFLEQRAREIESGIDPAKAQDLREAYDTAGRLHTRLEYLPTCVVPCAACSERDEVKADCLECQVFQPELFNRFFGCDSFQPATSSLDDAGAGPERLRHEPRRTALDALGLGGNFRADRRTR